MNFIFAPPRLLPRARIFVWFLLFAATEKSALLVIDAMTGQLRHVEPKMGQSLWAMLNP